MVFFVIAMVVATVVSLWAVFSPRSLYWVLHAWQYRNPDANEPSDVSYATWRISGVVFLVVLIVAAVGLWSLNRESSAAQSCHDELIPGLQQQLSDDNRDTAVRAWAADHDLEVTITRKRSTDAISLPTPDPHPRVTSRTTSYSFSRDDNPVFWAVIGDNIRDFRCE